MKTTVSTSTESGSGARHSRSLTWLVLVLLFGLIPAACTTTPPQGEPIDMEAMRTFAPFELKGLDGQQHRLQDYLDKITLVSFFFPT